MNITFEKKIIGILFFIGISTLYSLNSLAQPVFIWDKTYGGNGYEEFHSVKSLSDGNVIYGGSTQSRGNQGALDSTSVTEDFCDPLQFPWFDFWLMKTDVFGNKIWDKRFGGTGVDNMWVVIETKDGGFLCGGESDSDADPSCDKSEDSFGGRDWWLVKTDSDGNKLWDRTYGTDGPEEILRDMIELEDGSILAVGKSDRGLSGNFTEPVAGNSDSSDVRLAKIAPNGDLIWDKTFGGSGDDFALKLLETEQGDIVIAGQSTSRPGTDPNGTKNSPIWSEPIYNSVAPFAPIGYLDDIWILMVDKEGNLKWETTFGGTGKDVAVDIDIQSDGILIAGQSNSEVSGNKTEPSKGLEDYWLIKIDNDGNKIWEKTYGGSKKDDGFAIHVNDLDEILFGGVSQSEDKSINPDSDKSDAPEGSNDYWMLFLEPDGEIIWDVSFGGPDNDALFDMTPVSDGGVILGGHSASPKGGYKSENNHGNNGSNDWWIVKTNCKLELDLGPDTTICEGTKLLLDAEQLNCIDCQYRWSDNLRDSIREFSSPLTRTLSIEIKSRSGCETSDTITINVNSTPEVLFTSLIPPRCPGENTGAIKIVEVEGGTPPYYFSFNKGPLQEYNEFHNLSWGSYDMSVMDIKECRTDTTFFLRRPPELDIIIDGTGTFRLGESTTLIPMFSEPVDTFYWLPSPWLPCEDCLNPTVAPLETTTYPLTAFDENGCKYIKSGTVAIEKPRQVFLPTAFSPNNDGENDTYMFYLGSGIKKVNMFRIYDRWGELLYEVEDYSPGEYMAGWDGKQSGKDMPTAPYVYYCEVEYLDGWKEFIEGHFTLVR